MGGCTTANVSKVVALQSVDWRPGHHLIETGCNVVVIFQARDVGRLSMVEMQSESAVIFQKIHDHINALTVA